MGGWLGHGVGLGVLVPGGVLCSWKTRVAPWVELTKVDASGLMALSRFGASVCFFDVGIEAKAVIEAPNRVALSNAMKSLV